MNTHIVSSPNYYYCDQVIKRNIKRSDKKSSFETLKELIRKEQLKKPSIKKKSTINNSYFDINKKYFEVDNCITTSKLSKQNIWNKGIKISSDAIFRYLVYFLNKYLKKYWKFILIIH